MFLKRKKSYGDDSVYSNKIEKYTSEFMLRFNYPIMTFFFFFVATFVNTAQGNVKGENFVLWLMFSFLLMGLITSLWYMVYKYHLKNFRAFAYLVFFVIFAYAQVGTEPDPFELGVVCLMASIYAILGYYLKFRPTAMYFTINLFLIILIVQAFLDQSPSVINNWGEVKWISMDVLLFFYLGVEILTRIFFRGSIWNTQSPENYAGNGLQVAQHVIHDTVRAAVRSGNPMSTSYLGDYCETCGELRPCHDCERVCAICYKNESMCDCD